MGRYWAVIPAAGVGRRMGGGDRPKQYRLLLGRPVIGWALERLLGHPKVAGAVVALAADDPHWDALGLDRQVAGKPVHRVEGGAERRDSVRAALAYLGGIANPEDRVLVHDAVRPCLSAAELDRLIDEGGAAVDGALLATPVRDTLKRADGDCVGATVSREGLWQAQTPQLFPLRRLSAALDAALAAGVAVTDEAQAVEWHDGQPRLVTGEAGNLKITHQADLDLAAAVLTAQRAATEREQTA
ncbi:2-C-methyl-D-erythritol 4-phosphate cytidylyltransferase [Halorhodospira halophila]|uniref:2-C-methyl-D-erythritol 4-phosphate cytidylyltransferase n=1 Tax=Halorhodospira halophila (strain DSM 244 / SL1) TaxID=349124 RepID=ISPD_HALHL|nr:2-C-methyl-D-erythritol 4-phosphate cytidylyltransferase [Halorhodospira halophila]A1WWZ0.1 RecName: Full=2-C-methyl-D-erythritol 4-phosphate cytidylyltransferase; AltName: Full=4-diphosphocytidyl-2C-methyl-D-erythritol synthase; AltName: Full=MEP cytidylyltransferase; Short=MCT [Halorhodospira halophila SL1]ABM62202.1 2-C-methyl-D-erythritol 4-phosphate cytidylyltransferase [Halorhodospira halophila SL1]MBK1729177.1 2-C-methyl-D-erythritol 4-phosphate cytidylyltransferase [Halorhodospira hal